MGRKVETVGGYQRYALKKLIKYFINYRVQLFYFLETIPNNSKDGQAICREIVRMKEQIDRLKYQLKVCERSVSWNTYEECGPFKY